MAKYAATLPLAIIRLDRASTIPLYLQIYENIRRAILKGQIVAGVRLPSTRDLASSLKVSRNTVMTAFEQLFAEGYIEGKVGAGTYVAQVPIEQPVSHASNCQVNRCLGNSDSTPHNLSQRGMQILAMQDIIFRYRPDQTHAFRPGLPALDAFPTEIWSELVTQHWRYANSDLLSYGDPRGYRRLRECIAEHLRVSRAMRCNAQQVIIVSGSQQALDLAVRVLLDPGDAAWIEDPGYLGARSVLLNAGANLIPIPVDEQGLNVEAGILKSPHAKLAYVTPSHQFPLGVSMSLARRLALLHWAKQSKAWILEDDYDSEYRYTGQPLAALQGLDDAGRTIYMGTFSKVLFPSLRLGYLVVPPELVDAFAAARAVVDRHSPLLEQATLADFIGEGHLSRHIRRMRVLYAERQAVLTSATRGFSNLLEVHPCETGMHLLGLLPEGIDDRYISQQLAVAGITAPPLSAYRLQPCSRGGLVLGYAAVNSDKIYQAARRMETVLRTAIDAQPSDRLEDISIFSTPNTFLPAM